MNENGTKPDHAFHQMDDRITKSGFSEVTQITRQRVAGWEVTMDTGIIVIPCARGEPTKGDFLLRVYSDMEGSEINIT